MAEPITWTNRGIAVKLLTDPAIVMLIGMEFQTKSGGIYSERHAWDVVLVWIFVSPSHLFWNFKLFEQKLITYIIPTLLGWSLFPNFPYYLIHRTP